MDSNVDQILSGNYKGDMAQPAASNDPVESILSGGEKQDNPPANVTNAMQYLYNKPTSQDYNGLCEAFTEQMSDLPNLGGTAADAWNNQKENQVPGKIGMKAGDRVYFAPDMSNNGEGHTGIYLGSNHYISATDEGVKIHDLAEWQRKTGQKIMGYIKQ